MATEMELEGLQGLVDRLQRMGSNASRVENKALREGAQIVQQEASELAPRDPNSSEHMADNILISNVKMRDGVKTIEVGPTRGDNSQFFYAKFDEFGTSKMAAQPFMDPAAQRTRREVIEKMKEVIRGAIKS